MQKIGSFSKSIFVFLFFALNNYTLFPQTKWISFSDYETEVKPSLKLISYDNSGAIVEITY